MKSSESIDWLSMGPVYKEESEALRARMKELEEILNKLLRPPKPKFQLMSKSH
jgi:hypothetical protein